jgi:hypothetical protein
MSRNWIGLQGFSSSHFSLNLGRPPPCQASPVCLTNLFFAGSWSICSGCDLSAQVVKMVRIRHVGRSNSDHRVCEAFRFARAADYRARIHISMEKQEAVFASVNQPCSAVAPRRRKRKYNKRLSEDGASLRDGCPSNREKRSVNGESAQQVPGRSCKEIAKEATGEFSCSPMLNRILSRLQSSKNASR